MINDNREDQKIRVIEYLKRFPFYKWAAKSIGKSEDTLRIWRDEDPEFSARVESARAEGMKYFGGRATPDLILKSADPETFKERMDITSGDKPIPILSGNNVSKHNGNSQATEVK